MYRPDTSEEVQGISLTHFCREICLSALKERNPELNPRELKAKFFEEVYGPEFSAEETRKIASWFRSGS